ncbi:hypothetical protein BH23CHL4_BH23CHL4_08240 [soil metagenome]
MLPRGLAQLQERGKASVLRSRWPLLRNSPDLRKHREQVKEVPDLCDHLAVLNGSDHDCRHLEGSHPVVGTWIFDNNVDDPSNSLSITTFFANGAMLDTSVGNRDSLDHGVWEPTGENTVSITFVGFFETDDGVYGTSTIRGIAEISEDGQTITDLALLICRPKASSDRPWEKEDGCPSS